MPHRQMQFIKSNLNEPSSFCHVLLADSLINADKENFLNFYNVILCHMPLWLM